MVLYVEALKDLMSDIRCDVCTCASSLPIPADRTLVAGEPSWHHHLRVGPMEP